MLIKSLENTFESWLSLIAEPDFIKVIFGTVIANRLNTLPIWLMVVGKAATGKSEIVSSMDNSIEIEAVAQPTAKSLASGINMNSKDMKGQEEPSLLNILDKKVMTVRDATTLVSMTSTDREFFFSVLRSAFDGKYELFTGATRKKFTAKFGIIISATPHFEHDQKFAASLGERFLKFRPKEPMDSDELWEKIENTNNTAMKEELGKKAVKYLRECDTPTELINPIPQFIREYARLLPRLRTHVLRDKRGDVISSPDPTESPIRVAKQLTALYTALVHISDKKSAKRIIRRITRDSTTPFERILILEGIYSGFDTLTKLHKLLNIGEKPLSTHLENLVLLKIINTINSADGREKNGLYVVKETYAQLFGVSPSI